jgi:hypothetical protein
MKLIIVGGLLVSLVLTFFVAIAGFSNFSNDLIIDQNIIDQKNNIQTVTEESCFENFDKIECKENVFLVIDGKKSIDPLVTGYTIKEKVFVPKFIEKEIYIEKKLIGEEKESPADRIKDSDLKVYGSFIRLNINDAFSRKYIDSNSMDPFIDEGTTTIEIRPKKEEEIKIGDIIAYSVEGYSYAFVHRVNDIGTDHNGIYFITKGDNYFKVDPEKIRFGDIEGIIVGILY